MIEYLENIKAELKRFGMTNDPITLMLAYDEKEEDVSAYDFIEGYLCYVSDLIDLHDEMIDDMVRSSGNTKFDVFIKSIGITNVKKEENGYSFKIELEEPFRCSVDISVKESGYNNRFVPSGYIVIGEDEESEYLLSAKADDSKGLAVAKIFAELVDIETLVEYLEKESFITHTFNIGTYAESVLPFNIKLNPDGVVELYYTKMKEPLKLFSLKYDEGIVIETTNVYSVDKNMCENLVWYLENMFIRTEALSNTDGYENFEEYYHKDYDMLADKLKDIGLDNSISYKIRNIDEGDIDDPQTRYFVRKDKGTYASLGNVTGVTHNGDHTVTFEYEDGSDLTIDSSELVVINSDVKDSKAVRALKNLNN